jgi:hypothetical protein
MQHKSFETLVSTRRASKRLTLFFFRCGIIIFSCGFGIDGATVEAAIKK